MRHDHHRVPVLVRQLPQCIEQSNLRADIEVQRRLIEQQQQRLLRQRSRQHDALLLAARHLIHPAIRQMRRSHLRERILRDRHVVRALKLQRSAVRVPPLEHKFPRTRRKQQRTLLLHHRNTLRTNPRRQRMRRLAVQQNTARKRRLRACDQFQQRRFPARVRPENRHDFAGPRLKAARLQREQRRLRRIWRIRVADLFDAQPNFLRAIGGLWGKGRHRVYRALTRRFMQISAATNK